MKLLIIVILSALLVSTAFAGIYIILIINIKIKGLLYLFHTIKFKFYEADRIANGNTATLDKTYFFASITVG